MLNGVRLLSEGSLSGDTWEARLPVELRSLRQLRRRKVQIREQSDRRALPSRQSIVPRSATPFLGTRARMTTGSGSSVEQRERVKWATCQIFWPLIEFVPFANSIATTCSRFGGLSGRSGGRRRFSTVSYTHLDVYKRQEYRSAVDLVALLRYRADDLVTERLH